MERRSLKNVGQTIITATGNMIVILAVAITTWSFLHSLQRIGDIEHRLDERPPRSVYLLDGIVRESDRGIHGAMVIEDKNRIYLDDTYRRFIGRRLVLLVAIDRDGTYQIIDYRVGRYANDQLDPVVRLLDA